MCPTHNILCYNIMDNFKCLVNGGDSMFTKEELLVIEDALKIADTEYIKLIEENKNNKNRIVAYNRKQKKLWLVQNKLKKLIEEK
jgi:hypothetical protein